MRRKVIFTLNTLHDLVRFVFGRGVLFSLSSVWLLLAVILKDFLDSLWNFGIRSTEPVITLNILTSGIKQEDRTRTVSPGQQR